ncbi:MAG: SPOR domain-containing protein [Paludibacteraceae bacterium]|nr:SPOR domain-containing protein [Paludibacteraceae bacterium]
MKKSILIFAMVLSTLSIKAQDIVVADSMAMDSIAITDTINIALIVDDMENAVIHQDSLIRQLMIDKRLGIQRGQVQVNGFRVQVYSSNQQQVAKNEALILQQTLESQLDMPVYAISEPPFWKVRIGNFLTREEATEYRTEIISQFPELQGSTYVVPDKVIIIN